MEELHLFIEEQAFQLASLWMEAIIVDRLNVNFLLRSPASAHQVCEAVSSEHHPIYKRFNALHDGMAQALPS